MAKVTRLVCDDCHVDETLRKVHTYTLRFLRDGRAFGRTEEVDFCNPCYKKNETRVLQSFMTKIDARWSGKKRSKDEEENDG
jgi:hypothetical protein